MPHARHRRIIFDLDDTLIATSHLYHQAIWACGVLIHEALGTRSPFPSDVLKLQQEVDAALIEGNGFVKNRFPESLVQTYVRLAEQRGMTPRREVKAAIRHTAKVHRTGPFTVLPGAREAVKEARSLGDELYLVTMGELALQRRKIRDSGLRSLFDGVHVTGIDKREAMALCIKGADPAKCVMIGDSLRSDIAAAISLGMHAIWIEGDPWPYAKAEIDARAYHRASSIAEVPALLRAIG